MSDGCCKGVRLVVTGGRDFEDRDFVWRVLDGWHNSHGVRELAHGDCPTGADALAGEWANERNVPCVAFRADWKRDGRRAGPIRNGMMLRTFQPDRVLAFPGGRGTADCVAKAHALRIRVTDYTTEATDG